MNLETTSEDIQLTCCECETPFVWTVGEQRFFAEHGLVNRPRRCRPCRQAKQDRPTRSRSHYPAYRP